MSRAQLEHYAHPGNEGAWTTSILRFCDSFISTLESHLVAEARNRIQGHKPCVEDVAESAMVPASVARFCANQARGSDFVIRGHIKSTCVAPSLYMKHDPPTPLTSPWRSQILRLCERAMFSKSSSLSSTAASVLENIVHLVPERVFPMVVQRFADSLTAIAASHQLTRSIQVRHG